MQYLNAQNVKALAKEYGEAYREQETRVGADFLQGINMIVEQVVKQAVRSQDDSERMTLQMCEWMKRQINNGEKLTEGAV